MNSACLLLLVLTVIIVHEIKTKSLKQEQHYLGGIKLMKNTPKIVLSSTGSYCEYRMEPITKTICYKGKCRVIRFMKKIKRCYNTVWTKSSFDSNEKVITREIFIFVCHEIIYLQKF